MGLGLGLVQGAGLQGLSSALYRLRTEHPMKPSPESETRGQRLCDSSPQTPELKEPKTSQGPQISL